MAHFHVLAGAGDSPTPLAIRTIGLADLGAAVRAGFDDFMAMPSHLVFLGLFYPVVGICLAALSSGQSAWPLLYPLMSGFALIGPFAAIGLYEISRRREAGLDTSWRHIFSVWRSPAIPSILSLGVGLAVLFVIWLSLAQVLSNTLLGPAAPASLTDFLRQVLTTPQGWALVILGNLAGLVFAVLALSISVISFPLMLDRDVGAAAAIQTSVRAVARNPVTMAAWGLLVAASLVAGFLALFVGLALVVPILGHATWHLYRRVVLPGDAFARR